MDNADLEKLKISPGKLLPKFKASVCEYSVTVASSVEQVKLSPLTSDGGASLVVEGADSSRAVKLTEGKTSEVQIIVTAEDGKTTKTYTIKIRRLSADDATLSQLDLSAGSLKPSFSPLTTNYECYLPYSVENLSIRVKTEDVAMKASMKDGSPIGTVQLNPGHTRVEINVVSVSGKGTTTYTVNIVKCQLPATVQLKKKDSMFECAVCCGVVHRPCLIKGGEYVFCQVCLEELTRTSKEDPFTGKKLEEEQWMEVDYERDGKLGKELAVCPLASGDVEAAMQQIGAKLLAERLKTAQNEEPTEACKECSKKVPTVDMALHKETLCTAKNPVSLPKHEVKLKSWERRLVDESSGSDVKALLKMAEDWETRYLKALPKLGETPHYEDGKAPLDFLQTAARCYATAIKCSSRDLQAHIGLGLVMEEFFYAEDLYGQQREVQEGDSEGEAEISSKEEEFLAICKLHGIAPSAPIAVQLKAVEAEYHSLKDSGQTHKAEHVQGLHAWKSKKALQASQGSYSVDDESPLYRAKLKFQDAVGVNSSDGTACYHLGRLCLLLGDKEAAKQYLTAAIALKPTLSHARFCLGLALSTTPSAHAKSLIAHGLTEFLTHKQELHETIAEPERKLLKELNSKTFLRGTNTLLVEGFLQLAQLGGHAYLKPVSCLLCVARCVSQAHLHHRASTFVKLLWSSLKARSSLLNILHKQKDPSVLRHCKQLSGLITNSNLASTPQLRDMQTEVFQLGVVLQPSSSEALTHLGNGQLMQYDATNEAHWLQDAELSFRASIAMEGGAILPTIIPDQLKEQDWWKKKTQTKQPAAASDPKKSSTTPQKPQTTAAAQKQPATQPAKASSQTRGKPASQTTRAQPTSGAKPSARAAGGAQAGRRPAGGAAAKQPGGTGRHGQPGGTGRLGQPGGASRPGQRGGNQAAASKPGVKNVATLGELKSGTKQPDSKAPPQADKQNKEENKSTSSTDTSSSQPAPVPTGKTETNKRSHHPRLGLARTLAKNPDPKKQEESHTYYREVMTMSPEVHDAYIELGELLAKSDPVGAVDVYAKFPFTDPPTFDDAFLHGEIVRLLMKSESYDDPRLCTSLVAMGKALGIGVLEKQVSILENKFKTGLLKQVYSGVHGKPVDDPELQAFFKFKCWL